MFKELGGMILFIACFPIYNCSKFIDFLIYLQFYTDIYRIFLHLLEQVNAFRERRALSLTLNDTKTAVNKLHQMANVVVGIIVLGIWLLILDIASSHFFVLLGSQILVAVFMFGNTLKMIFEAIIFLFVMHPFDVGDRCEIGGVQVITVPLLD